MQSVAQSWLVADITAASPKAQGWVYAAQNLPVLLLTLLAGVYLDHWPKRRILVVSQTLMAVLALVLAFLDWHGVVQLWHILVLATFFGIANAVDLPARHSFMGELVGRDLLPNAITLNSTIFNLARVVGPAVAGVMIGILGTAGCFFLNSLSFIPVILVLATMPLAAIPRPASAGAPRPWHSSKAAIAHAMARPRIACSLALIAALSLFTLNFNILIPVYAKRDLHLDAKGFGWLMASFGVGATLEAVYLALRGRRQPRMLHAFAGAGLLSFWILAFSFFGGFAAACLFMALAGVGLILFNTSVNSIIQLSCDETFRGRIVSLYVLAFIGVAPAGGLLVGYLAEHTSVPFAARCCGGAGLAVTLATMFWYRLWSSREARGLKG